MQPPTPPPDADDPMSGPLDLVLRPLDPSRDAAAWERSIQAVVGRAARSRTSLGRALVRDGRVALVLAAAAALVAWSARRPAPAPVATSAPAAEVTTTAAGSEWDRWMAGESPDALRLLAEGGAP